MPAERRKPTGMFEAERTTGSHDVLDCLFVYGTLRQGQTARSLIANQIKRCVPAHTPGSLYTFPMGYPGYVEGDGKTTVVGEVIWLTELAATFGLLDAYEGQDFARILRQVSLDSGELIWAWIYALADPSAVELGTLIQHGDWVRYWSESIR
jgi:gamma-glutamylcyclotransferase (GGCT)/AIG2-like uncharacterized protein YtfP